MLTAMGSFLNCRLAATVGFLIPAAAIACMWSAAAGAATVNVTGSDSVAIEAALTQAKPGDVVRLPAGTYAITETIRLRPGVRLTGAGADATVLAFHGQTPLSMLSVTGADDAEVCDLTLTGNDDPNARQGIVGSDARGVRIRNVTVRDLAAAGDFGPHGIRFTGRADDHQGGITDSEVADCRFERIGVGAPFGCAIRLSNGSSRNRVVGNTITATGRGGIFADNASTDLVIRGNTVAQSGGEGLGIEVWEGCDRAVIEDNRIDHWLSIGGCDSCAARGNTVSDTSGEVRFCGIEVIGSKCVVTDNTVDGGQWIGISVSGTWAKQFVFYGRNTVAGCRQWGAQFQGESGGIACHHFVRCAFIRQPLASGAVLHAGVEGQGFRFNGNCRRVTFDECGFEHNGRLGLQFIGSDLDLLRFSRCSIRANAAGAAGPVGGDVRIEWDACDATGNGSNELPAGTPLPGKPFVAHVDGPAGGVAGETLAFTNATPDFGAGWTALWDFDDGPPVAQAGGNLSPVGHVFSAPGTYRVTLVVWDDVAHAASVERVVEIKPR